MHSPLVSVIIPTFNRALMVIEAVESVLAQKFDDFEIIVVDDGSKDDTQNRLLAYKNRITFLSQKNKGVSAARNTGVKNAKGEFIAFLDSDDLWLPDKLSVQTDFFINQNRGALICQTEEVWIRKGLRVNPCRKHQKRDGFIFSESLHLCLVSPSAVMLKRSFFEKTGGFDENLPACEDYDLWLRVSCRYPIFLIDTPLIVKRGGHDGQLSAQPCLDRYRIQSLQNLLEKEPLTDLQREEARAVLAKKCAIYSQGCLKRGKTEEAKQYMDLAKYLA